MLKELNYHFIIKLELSTVNFYNVLLKYQYTIEIILNVNIFSKSHNCTQKLSN